MLKHLPDQGLAAEAAALAAELTELAARIRSDAATTLGLWNPAIEREDFRASAENLAHYLAFRKIDVSPLQDRLARLGLSSLGRCEAHVMASINAVVAALGALSGVDGKAFPSPDQFDVGRSLLNARQNAIFGNDPGGPRTRIMVTLPTEAAADPALVRRMIAEGADCARINCAHDDAEIWSRMIANAQAAASDLGRDVRIVMDLGGPKIRIDTVNEASKRRFYRGDRFAMAAVVDHDSETPEVSVEPVVLLEHLAPGVEVWINDGKLGARVVEVTGRRAVLDVMSAREKGERIKPEKGVNLPGVPLSIPALTPEDMTDLDFVAAHADVIGYSFVQRPSDITSLFDQLAARRPGKPLPAVMLKIETPLAVRNLPRLIVQAGSRAPVTVMIARGDLAVEIGLERLSEIQEEILWLCEAAHVPVVWATEVLNNMVKDGTASRAEATDAAMGQRAECVMLNKGPFLAQAVAFLNGVLRRMDRHQLKKMPRLGALHSWQDPQTLA